MSLLSPLVGNMARTVPSGKTPVEDLYDKWTVAAAVFLVMLELSYLTIAGLPPIGKPWIDHTDFVLGRDFLNTWVGARTMFTGGPAPYFDFHTYNVALRALLGGPYQEHFWSYPPHLMLFIWPFGLLPYLVAYIAWCLIGIALYVLACRSALPHERLLFLAAAPGIAVCVFFGQNGFYTSALLVGGLANLDRRPVLSGVLFGILTIKPQLGLLLPVVLLLERRWVTIAAAVATAAALVLATAMLFGWDVWVEFWQKVVPQQQWLTVNGKGLLFAVVSSVFYGARMWHLPLSVAWAAQGVVSAAALAGLVWTYWKRRDPALSKAYLIIATFLFTPYILNYDMVVFGFVVALLRNRPDNTMRDHKWLLALWTLPASMMLGTLIFVPLAPIVLIGFAWRLLRRLARPGASDARPLPAEQPALAAA